MTIAEVNKAIRILLETELARGVKEEDLKTSVANIMYGMYTENKVGFMDLRVALDLLNLEPDGVVAELDKKAREAAIKDYQIAELEQHVMADHHLTLEGADQELIKSMYSTLKEGGITLEAFYRFTWALGYGIDPQYLILTEEDRKNHNISFFKRR